MTGLGIFQSESAKAADEASEHTLRAELIKRMVLGGSWSLGAGIVFFVYDLLRNDPHDAFPLLESWGPKAIGALIALFIFGEIAKGVLAIARGFLSIGTRAVVALEHGSTALQGAASAIHVAADAVQQTATKDNVKLQEVETLVSLTAQRNERLGVGIHDLREGQQTMIEHLGEMRRAIDKLAGGPR